MSAASDERSDPAAIGRRPLLVAALASSLVSACASKAPPPGPAPLQPIAAEGLRADVDVLQHAYETLHPGLYRYTRPIEMRLRFAALRRSFDRDFTVGEAYLAFSEFAATIRCGHTYANFFNQPKTIRAALFDSVPCVPYQFRWLGGRMIVTRNLSSDAGLVPGTEVISINHARSDAILERLITVARADGSNDAKRLDWLQVQGQETIEAFDVFLPLFFPQIGWKMTLVVREPSIAGRLRQTNVAAITAAQRRETGAQEPLGNAPVFTLDRTRPKMAVLRMPTWALYDSKWDWRGFLQKTFEDLVRTGMPALVIDLRANEGGQDVGDVLLSHLIEAELPKPPVLRLVRARKVPDDLNPYLDTWDESFRDWGDDVEPFDDRFLRFTRFAKTNEDSVIRPLAPHYRGRVFVLIGATNSSATFEFARQVKAAGLGTLIGQTTGGNLRGINGGAFFFVRLPNSRIELDLPLIGQFPPEPEPDAGLEPDIRIVPTLEALTLGQDQEMTAVLEQVQR